MNRIYHLVWNAAQQAWVVCGELAKGHTKSGSKSMATVLGLMGVLAASAVYAAPPVNALPTGESVASGTATFDRSVSNQLTVNQSSSKLITNWNSFDIGSAATVNFVQPDVASIALNRVTSASPTEIFGQLNANGQVFIVNPAGITFGLGSQANTGSLLASALSISDSNFLNNNLTFERNGARGQVNNLGTLTANEGNVVFLGPTLQNQRTIQSVKGNILMGNGDKLKVADHNLSLLQASSIISLIRNTGTLNATRVEVRKGQVILLGEQANPRSKVEVRGTVNSQNFWARSNQINVNGALTTSGSTALEATHSVNISAPLNITGNGVLLSFVHGSNPGNSIVFSGTGKVNLAGTNPYVRINGNFYQVIKNLAELQAIGANESSLAGRYVLGADIDASATSSWNSGAGFSPIGNSTTPFTGALDGFGYHISGLYIYRPDFDDVNLNIGLFGVAQNSSLKNIRLNNVNIVGYENLGGLVGLNISTAGASSTIDNNSVSGQIQANYAIERECNSTACNDSHGTVDYDEYVYGGKSVGGLIGSNNSMGTTYIGRNTLNVVVTGLNSVGGLNGYTATGAGTTTFENNSVAAVVNGHAAVGGLVGSLSSSAGGQISILKNSSTGQLDTPVTPYVIYAGRLSVAGGLLGYVDATNAAQIDVSNNYAAVSVSGNGELGGLIGGVYASNNASININKSYATGNVTASGGMAGGLIGYNSVVFGNINIDQTYASGKVAASSTSVGGLIGMNRLFGTASAPKGEIRISNSYWDADTTQQASAIGLPRTSIINNLQAVSGAGGSYPDAYSQASYSYLDFQNDWLIAGPGSRPTLQALIK